MELHTERIDSKEEFSLMKRSRSFSHAGRGLLLFFKTTPNAWIELLIFIAVLVAGYVVQITKFEFLLILLVSALVFTAETLNTAIEIDINLTSPEYHPYARDTKDVAAAAVLIASLFAVVTGIIVFLPYFI